MFFIALKRLWHSVGLTLLSIMAVALAVGVAVSIPVFAKAVSFVVLRQELDRIGSASKRPPFSMRIYVLPGAKYSLSLDRARTWQGHVTETIVSELGLPLISQNWLAPWDTPRPLCTSRGASHFMSRQPL